MVERLNICHPFVLSDVSGTLRNNTRRSEAVEMIDLLSSAETTIPGFFPAASFDHHVGELLEMHRHR